MTPTTGTAGTIRHPEVSEISDLTEGLLSPSRTAEVRRHLAGCTLCADVLASLEEIRSLLGTLPGPPRMPSAIAGRIDAALAAEALLDSTASRTEARTAPEPRVTDDVSRETNDVSRETAGVSRETTSARADARRPAGHPSGAAGPGRRRARRRIAVLTGLAGAAACVLGVLLFNGLSGTGAHESTTSNNTVRAAGSPAPGDYTAQGLQQNVHRLLADGPTANTTKTAPGDSNRTMELQDSPPGLAPAEPPASPGPAAPVVPRCVQQATGRTETPLAAEPGHYQGTAVYLLVLPHAEDSALVDAYLVASGCAENPSTPSGKPLLTRTYPRG
ncbi:anti-sigma factor family protein [Streptomyces sp. NPDC048387]|uniref:anti-sigma factor family protein n=1 Tax=Streptomyces sp. NPDC048387 TaxID=3365542 RepID=UPI003718941F